jgi:hypothetical protein
VIRMEEERGTNSHCRIRDSVKSASVGNTLRGKKKKSDGEN